MVQVQLLGGVGAVSDRGQPLDVGPAKCRTLLAALGLSVGEAVSVSRLVDLVWDEAPPRTAEKTLQGYVAQLRRSLGPETIVRSGAAYRLDLEPDRVDAARFRRRLAAGDVDGALATWTGTPLVGLDAPGLRPAADGLVEQWLDASEEQLGRRSAVDPAGTVAALTELTAAHPFREGLWALLLTALYRAGRQADALAAFQRARAHLVDELGIEPGPRLRRLEAQILDRAEELDDVPSASGSAAAPVRGRPTGTVTFGYAEVADQARLWGAHRRKMALAMARLGTVFRDVTARHGGTEIGSTGESLRAAFSRADDAADWATELQIATEQEPWPGGVDVRLRVALHTGETEEHDGGYFGPAVHTVARLAAAASAGQTVVSGLTARLLERDDLRDLGTHRFEGVSGDHDVWQLDAGDHLPLRSASRTGNLPRQSTRVLGRDPELDAVAAALRAFPIVTLVGPGGVGKTTLALAASRRVEADAARRVWLVELAEIASSDDVATAVAETLGVTGGAGRTLTESVVAVLRSRPTLLVLDNCEHVLDGAAALARAVAEDGADTRVLATSREGLGVSGEQAVPVTPLDATGAAVELFAERARAAAGTFDLDADRADVEAICRRLDGLPLAIELAAARTTSLTPAQLLARLDGRLDLLGGGRRSSGARHRTLRATVQWSYDLLSRPQQQLFERLAAFAGPFDLLAAEAVAGDADPLDTDHLLGDLVERSLVTVESGPFGRRFRLLETLRQFAAEQLAAHGDREAVAGWHARWCRDAVAHIGGLLAGPGEIEGVARLAELWPNLRAAVEWACSSGDPLLADALVRPLVVEVDVRRQAEIGDWAERILDLLPPEDEDRIAFWMLWAGHRHVQAGDRETYEALVQRHGHRDHLLVRCNEAYLAEVGEDLHAVASAAVTWLRERGEEHAADLVEVSGVAASLMTRQRFAELAALAADMAERHRRGAPTLRYFALGMQGYAAQYQGREEAAARFFDEAEATELPAGTYRVVRTATARIAFQQGHRRRAYRMLRDNLDEILDTDYTDVARMVAVEFITMMAAVDRLPDAARVLTYLDTTGDYATLARQNMIADAVRRIEEGPDPGAALDGPLDAHGALLAMRDVLDELTDDVRTSP